MSGTNGVLLMPPPFEDGLDVWSREDGTAGSATYDGASDAALVPADQDFGGCLEILKTESTQRLRYMGQTPFSAGVYLRVTVRVKAVSGPLPTVRIAGWPGQANGNHVPNLVEVGPAVALTGYGEVFEVTAVIGSGDRDGVDMVWGNTPSHGHFGIDITGSNGAVLRIDDVEIHDITPSFTRDLLDWVDVLDYGAKGDGITDDSAAFEAADDAANGRQVLVPAGLYYLGQTVTMESPVRFEGNVTMPTAAWLALRANYELNSYIAAFGNEELAFKKAFQALLNFTDHEVLDLNGRQVDISGPIDMQAAVGNKTSFAIRRTIRNGTIAATASSNWTSDNTSSTAAYSPSNPRKLTAVAGVANIGVGSLVFGTGVGREVYVQAVNVAAQEVTLSQPLFGATPSQTYYFYRFKYMLDFSGFNSLQKMRLEDLNLQCAGHANAVMLAPEGSLFDIARCYITRPHVRGITSIGRGCQGMQIDNTRFFSNESPTNSDARQSVALNVNANDLKLRNSWFQHFRHSAVLNGTGHMLVGNHWFQGDGRDAAPRLAGIVFTGQNMKSVITGNYCDNSSIEITNEHHSDPSFANEFSFGGLTITGNIFTANSVNQWFRWIIVKPYGPGHYIQGLSVIGNTFRTINGTIGRIEKLDSSYASLDFSKFRNIVFEGNTFNGITSPTINPVTLEFAQNSANRDWVLNFANYLPFGAYARKATSITMDGPIKNASNQWIYTVPFVTERYGTNQNQLRLSWSEACTGRVHVTARCDNTA